MKHKLIMENWKRFLNEGEGDPLAVKMTDAMHEAWREGYQASKGNEPRFKPIPVESGVDAKVELSRIDPDGSRKIKIIDGVLQQDINQPANKIDRRLAHKLNGAPAVDYARSIKAIKISSPKDIDRLASEFHEVWMKHNEWQKASNPNLFVKYSSLSTAEKLKDLDQLKVGLGIQYGPDSKEMQQFNKAYQMTKVPKTKTTKLRQTNRMEIAKNLEKSLKGKKPSSQVFKQALKKVGGKILKKAPVAGWAMLATSLANKAEAADYLGMADEIIAASPAGIPYEILKLFSQAIHNNMRKTDPTAASRTKISMLDRL